MFGNSIQKNTISREVENNNNNSMSSLKIRKENESSQKDYSYEQDNILNALNEGDYRMEDQGYSNKKYEMHY